MSNTTFSENQHLDNQSIISTGNDNINLHTGKLTMRFDVADMGSAAFPFTLALCYNKDSFTSTHCGLGWSLSAAQHIETFEEDENEYVQAAYHDGTGQIHYFWRGENATDAGGLGMTFSTTSYGYLITDRGGSRIEFVGKRLSAVRDANGNGINLSYNANGLATIIGVLANNPTNKTITLNYTDNRLTSVTDPAGRIVRLNYTTIYDTDLLHSILYPDDISVGFVYDSHDRIITVSNANGTHTEYTYTGNYEDRIKRISKCPSDSDTCDEFFEMTYQYGATKIKDRSGINKVYVFDASGRAITVYDEIITAVERTPLIGPAPSSFWDKLNCDYIVDRKPVSNTSVYRYADKKRCFSGSNQTYGDEHNLLHNSTFEENVTIWDSGWDGEGGRPTHTWLLLEDTSSGNNGVTYIDRNNACSLGCGEDPSFIEQIIPASDVNLSIGNTLLLTGWAKSLNSIELDDTVKFELRAIVKYGGFEPDCGLDESETCEGCEVCENFEYEEVHFDTFKASFDPNYTDWQYVSLPIQIDSSRTLNNITVQADYSYNNGKCYVDNIRLVPALAVYTQTEEKEPGYLSIPEDLRDENADNPPALTEYSITVFGKTQTIYSKTTTHNGIYTTVTEKNSNYDAVRQTVTDLDGNSFTSYFEYDDKHNLIRSQNYRGIMTEHSYNSVGMPTLTKTYYYSEMNPSTVSVPAKAFITETAYDSTGEFPISVTDERDETIKALSSYNITKGLLTSATDPNGNTTSYTYDANNDLITKVSMSASSGGEYSVLYGYDKRRLTKITHNDFDYEFTYDTMGRAQTTKIAGVDFSTNSYTLTETTTVETTYATGEKITVESDRHQNPIKKTYTDSDGIATVIATTEYDDLSRPTKNVDNVANKCYTYKYDSVGNVIEEKINDAAFKEYEYDSHNRLTKTTFHNGTETQDYLPIYDENSDGKIYADNTVVGVTLDGVFTHKSEHDEYSRITEKNLTLANATIPLLSDEITYISSDTRLTNMVSTVAQNINGNEQRKLRYAYDNNGNIIAINDVTEIESETDAGTPIAAYTYDEMNQLVREDNYLLNKTYIFTYDTSGNILSKKTYNSVLTTASGAPNATVNYTYRSTGWKDQLISFGGETITYDVLGNPTTYRGHNLTWGKLRQLNSFDSNTFTYNANGIRTSKNNITYTLDGTKILSETRPTGTIKYLYGINGVIGFTYNGNTYYYEKNIQGDVTAIVDVNGTIKAKYTYDAWGNHTITLNVNGIGTLNPIRYRSYYFDTETGLYYLQSRYYDPIACRFINADELVSTGQGLLGYNMFAYCNNEPVFQRDSQGTEPACVDIFDDENDLLDEKVGKPSGGGGVKVGGKARSVSAKIGGKARSGSVSFKIGGKAGSGSISFKSNGKADSAIGEALQRLNFPSDFSSTLKPNQIDPRVIDALKILEKTGIKPGQTQVSQKVILAKYDSYNHLTASSAYTEINGSLYVSEGHHTMIANVMKYGRLNTGINMGQIVNDPSVVTNMTWTKLIIKP